VQTRHMAVQHFPNIPSWRAPILHPSHQRLICVQLLRTILAIAHAGCFDGLWTPLSEDKFALYEEKETEEPMEPVR
jgi:hypothetical protein